MFCVAAGLHVQIRLIARASRTFDWRVLGLLGQALERLKNLLAYQIALLYPSLETRCSADLGESLLAIDYINAIAIFCGANSVVYLSKLVAERNLRGGDIVSLKDARVLTPATEKQSGREYKNNQFS